MRVRKISKLALILLLLTTGATGAVAAQETTPTPEDEEEEESSGVDLSGVTEAIEDLLDELSDFTDNWEETLAEQMKQVLFGPFHELATRLVDELLSVLTATPNVHPNPAVEDVHSDVLFVTYLLSSLVFITAGILHITGPILGFTYGEVRKILPRVLLALVFSAVSLPLLQYGVDLTSALTEAFKPSFYTANLQQMVGLSTGLVIAWIIQSLLLVAVVVLFIIRDVYILFVAAISPLLALGWSLPRVKRYSDTVIAGWFAALLIAPLDMLVLKFSFALMSGAGSGALQSVSNWVIGIASLTLLLLVPKQVWDASQTAVGMTRTTTQTVKQRQENQDDNLLNKEQRQQLRENRRRRRQTTSGKNHSYPWGDD
jgi:hypothetical protein